MTRGVGHFDGTVMWSVAASVLDSYPIVVVVHISYIGVSGHTKKRDDCVKRH